MDRETIGYQEGVPQTRIDFPEPVDDEPDLTQKQKGFIHHLCRENGLIMTPEFEAVFDELGTYQASSVIDQLLDMKAELRGQKPLDKSRITGIDFDDDEDDDYADDYAVKSPKATRGELKAYAIIFGALVLALWGLFS